MENCAEHSHISTETFFIKLKKKQPREVSIKKSCHYCEISNNTYFEKHLQTAASDGFPQSTRKKNLKQL